MVDVIEELVIGEKTVRKAVGTVNNKKIMLELEYDARYPSKWWVIASENPANLRLDTFMTRFFANRYFNKLVKKYGLVEIGGKGEDC